MDAAFQTLPDPPQRTGPEEGKHVVCAPGMRKGLPTARGAHCGGSSHPVRTLRARGWGGDGEHSGLFEAWRGERGITGRSLSCWQDLWAPRDLAELEGCPGADRRRGRGRCESSFSGSDVSVRGRRGQVCPESEVGSGFLLQRG